MRRTSRVAARSAAPIIAVIIAACQAPATDGGATPAGTTAVAGETAAIEPGWRWSMDRVLATVNAVRAGRSLAPAAWPDGGRVAVLLSFDVDNETVSLRFGQPTIGELSQGEYGGRAALGRVVAALDRYEIPATFFIPAVSLRLNPGMADVIRASGRHEFAVHGWIHEMNTEMPADIERELVVKAKRELEEMTGYAPVGYRAPSWNFSPNTLAIIRELGFLYDSSLMSDDSPYEITADGRATGIVELPVEWILDDAPLLNPRGNSFTPPRELLQVWMDEFDRAYDERGMFLLTMHPHVIGHRSRILVLEALIDHIRSKPGVWFGTHRAAAEHVRPVTAPAGT
ncbi:MAG: polysaccharide deacetylase [Gemmatimonadetes bacterium]|nr:polysaccharide deacetylase [Gemmatimonadota bacterium]